MTIVVDGDLEQLISDRLATGMYPSANALLRESLRLIQERDQAEEQQREVWKHEIVTGLQQLQEGRSVVLDTETLAGIKTRGRDRLTQQMPQEHT